MKAIIRKLGGLVVGVTLLFGALSSIVARPHLRVYSGYGPPTYYYYPYRYYYPRGYLYYPRGYYWGRHHYRWRHHRDWD